MPRLTNALNTVLFAFILIASVALCGELEANDHPWLSLIIIASIVGFIWSVIVNNIEN